MQSYVLDSMNLVFGIIFFFFSAQSSSVKSRLSLLEPPWLMDYHEASFRTEVMCPNTSARKIIG